MRPEDEIELEKEEYVQTSVGINEGAFSAGSSVNSGSRNFQIGRGDAWRSDDIDEWVSTIDVEGTNHKGEQVSTMISFNESGAMKIVESIAEMWNWEGDGYSSSE